MPHPSGHRADRSPSPLSAGLQWATAITTIGLEMALPPLFGAWVDQRFGTGVLWTVILAVLGFVVAMRHLWDLSKRLGRRDK
ncbi:MAG: AtpZ/AtpI family protein [Planctomycetaceae bacterium]|nr:AtpZ/AtpI family protein [Planctomycetaceae bacterium]